MRSSTYTISKEAAELVSSGLFSVYLLGTDWLELKTTKYYFNVESKKWVEQAEGKIPFENVFESLDSELQGKLIFYLDLLQ